MEQKSQFEKIEVYKGQIIVTFNSNAENFKKETSGLKQNTVRKIDQTDGRFQVKPGYIRITCREKQDWAIQELSDITDYDGYRIYSW